MALALVQESFQLTLDAHSTYCYALRTPGITPVSRQHFCCLEHVVQVIHRLALPHEDDIRQSFPLRQSKYLIHDVGYTEVTLPALLACLTKQTVHLATHLARYTQRGTFAIRYKDGLYEVTVLNREEVFHRAVL